MEYKEHYSNLSNNDIDNEMRDIAALTYDYEITIKTFIQLIVIYAFFSNIFLNSTAVISNTYKLYSVISLIIILYILYKLDIFTLLKLLVFLFFISTISASLYYNSEKLEFIILFYYSFNYQLEKIYNETKTNYNEVLFSIIFIAILSIISIVLYWDNIYTDAKKLSKCGKIINTIENNNRSNKPFVYNIIIMNNDLIDTSTSKYILKITYDFMKKKTIINYGSDNGDYTDGSESFKKPNYFSLYNKVREKKDLVDKAYTKASEEKTEADTKYEAKGRLVFYYFNLKTMESDIIENIDPDILSEERFKYVLVDEYNNKLPHDETSRDLVNFTKIYSKNKNYNINIINDIFYAKTNREKLFI